MRWIIWFGTFPLFTPSDPKHDSADGWRNLAIFSILLLPFAMAGFICLQWLAVVPSLFLIAIIVKVKAGGFPQ